MRLRAALATSIFSSFLISSIGTIGGISLTFVGWLIPLIVSHLVLFKAKGLPKAISHTLFFWLVFILGHGLASSAPHAIQRSIIIITPAFVALAASSLPYKVQNLKRIYSSILHTSFIFVLIIFTKVFLFKTANIDRLAAESVAAVCLGWICFIVYQSNRSFTFIFCFFLLASIPLLGANRGPLLALLMALVLAPPIQSLRRIAYKATVAFCLAIGMLVFYSPLAEKMFHAGHSFSDGISAPDALQTSGRIQAWAALLDGVVEAPYLGHGGNASEPFLTSTISEAFSHPHNDYLRILYDYGTLGFFLFLLTYFSLIRHCIRSPPISDNPNTKILRYIACGLFAPFFLLMSIDNALLYAAFFGNIHFLLIGINESIRRSKQYNPKITPLGSPMDSMKPKTFNP